VALGPNLSSNRNEYQGYLLEVKAAGADDLITIRYRLSRNSGSLNLLKT
jgi:hypothetical protein